jgi:glutaminyl-peptide cyclotransferase
MPHVKRRLITTYGTTEISTIEHLILLDLLGAPHPSIQSYFIDTAWLFDGLVSAERRLAESGVLYHDGPNEMAPGDSFFEPRTGTQVNFGYIGDDHVPFLHRGVSVLHLISSPFPKVWHTIHVRGTTISAVVVLISYLQDDATALDKPTMRRWNLILRVFMAEYLNLRPRPVETHPAPRDSASPARRSDNELVSQHGDLCWHAVGMLKLSCKVERSPAAKRSSSVYGCRLFSFAVTINIEYPSSY